MSKNLYYHLIIYSPKYPETKGHPSNPKTPLYHIPLLMTKLGLTFYIATKLAYLLTAL